MSLLIESIKLQDGEFRNLFYHEQRMNKALHLLCGVQEYFDLEEFLKKMEHPAKGLFKCRLVYDDKSTEVEFLPYTPRPINTLKIIEHDRINYEFKYKDRSQIDRLCEKKDLADDILIVRKGLVTDSSYCNIVFRRGRRWYTPWAPLLKGTQRSKLLEHDLIQVEEIRVPEIHQEYETFRLINAMLEFESPEISVDNIIS
jgi:4-amino-4-deoxychorismate lyase